MGWSQPRQRVDEAEERGRYHRPAAPFAVQQQQQPQPLDYEAKVDQRFSRQRRRKRLRSARVVSWGAEMDRQRRALEEEQAAHAFNNYAQQFPSLPPALPSSLLVNTPIPIINFRTNSDFPASTLPASQWMEVAKPPVPFDDAEYSHCDRIATRVLIPCDDYLAREVDSAQCVMFNGVNYMVNDAEAVIVPQPSSDVQQQREGKRAYWLQSKLHNAIYGQVRYGTVLQKLDQPVQIMLPKKQHHHSSTNEEEWVYVEWITTSEAVAVKEMNWEHIQSQRAELAEDPIKEVASMQYLEKWVQQEQEQLSRQQRRDDPRMQQESTEEESHIMLPLDLLSDDENLYSITPFCKGGRLLDILENKSRFSEPEARYWMRQILKGLSCLKKAGVAHRDMSPENLMVHQGNVYIIDMGMCLRIPSSGHDDHIHTKGKQQRSLFCPQTPCGKWYYLSPEVCLSEQPFDGPAVDLWAAGVILFIMLTGIPPWDEPKLSNENFKLMSTGHLVQILTERRVGLSVDAMDLLQRMFWLDPADRLSLEQVCAHPWITHSEYKGTAISEFSELPT